MRKWGYMLLLIIALICLKRTNNNMFAVRVVANSDSYLDQKIKERVKDEVLNFIQIQEDTDFEVFVFNIENNLEILENNLAKFKKTIKIEFKNHIINYKEYTNKEVKTYEGLTLLVEIETGMGTNFFSIIYPYFDETNDVIFKSYIYEFIKENFNAWNTKHWCK